MRFGNIAQAQFDGVDTDFLGQLIHRRFERLHADRFARRADRSGGHAVDTRDFDLQQTVVARHIGTRLTA